MTTIATWLEKRRVADATRAENEGAGMSVGGFMNRTLLHPVHCDNLRGVADSWHPLRFLFPGCLPTLLGDMNRIRLLPEHVANQIAAGEVVERPASVVKELVENSLDAGATRIAVEILAAGRGLIRVVDDGRGMSRDDALLCLERHATSKIASAADLSRVTTMGFRGEALPSIASVSRFTLTTRERTEVPTPSTSPTEAVLATAPSAAVSGAESAVAATQVVINGGKIVEVKEAGAPHGTTIEVRSLFFNVPARRKFLRSDETERAHIQHWLTTAALAHPQTGFHLTLEGRTVWQLPPLPVTDSSESRLDALLQRLRLLVGDGLALVPVDIAGELESVRVAPADVHASADISPPAMARVWGWVGAPGVSRGTRDDQHLFVNRRPIENRGLNAAMLEGYHNALMKGRYPLCCLFLELDPSEVDVNIHPAKREVKFHRERAVRRFVAEAVRGALEAWHRPPERQSQPGLGGGMASGRVPESIAPAGSIGANVDVPAAGSGFRLDTPQPASVPVPPPHPDLPGLRSVAPPWARRLAASGSAGSGDTAATGAVASPEAIVASAPVTSVAPSAVTTSTVATAGPVPLLAIPLRVVGVIGRLYVVLESDRGLVLLDQHAAHERVLYEQMLRRVQEGGVAPAQRLLLPETIEVSPKDAAFLRENLEVLTRLGVGLSEFGERTFLLDALPPFVKSAQPRRFGLELVDELRAAGATVNAWRLGESVVAKTVCRHSVKANDPLAGPELEALLENLRLCDMPYTCPHGRPTLIEMSFRELEKKFGRVTG